jgi:hypothetical protein
VLEFCRCLSILDHDKIVVLSLEAGSRKVRGARAQHMAIDLVAFKVHEGRAFLLDTDFDAGRFGQLLKGFRSIGFSQSTGIEVATIGRAGERLNDRPVRQNIGRKIDLPLRGIDQRDVHMFEVFGGRVVDYRRRIGVAQCGDGNECGASCYGKCTCTK